MPAISAMVYPVPAYVRVETNWADVGAATRAAVYRVDCITGQRVPLRPYVCFDGDFMDTSCGQGVWWDTEAQLDRCVYYCTQAQDAAGNIVTAPTILMQDSFTRVVANQWGTPDIGPPYSLLGGPAARFSTNGTRGGILNTTVGERVYIASGPIAVNMLAEGTIYPTATITGGTMDIGLYVQASAGDNGYEALVRFLTSGQLDARINRINSGSATILSTTTNIGTAAGPTAGYRIKFLAWGNQLKFKAWDVTTVEPAAWQAEITDPNPLTQVGGVGGIFRSQAGNSNSPFTPQWDNLLVTDPCAELAPIEVCSQDVVVPSSGDFRLGDPTRPCHDVALLFDAQVDPDCVPNQGIFFGNMADETFAANTNNFEAVNDRYPIVVARTRQAIASTLTIASKTFPDRDAVRTLTEPGSPLLLRGPAEYGINDRYMSVGDVTETRPVSDHRVTPRVITLPHVEVARPSSPTQGVCGARVDDLCDIYPTWDALIAAGLTWADLLRGKASNKTPIPDTVERTWSDVNSTYANWTAVNTGNTDWDDLRDGA